jgi:hypothetical protein
MIAVDADVNICNGIIGSFAIFHSVQMNTTKDKLPITNMEITMGLFHCQILPPEFTGI